MQVDKPVDCHVERPSSVLPRHLQENRCSQKKLGIRVFSPTSLNFSPTSQKTLCLLFRRMQELPRYVYIGGGHRDCVPTRLVQMTWGADHRALDGATLAKFSNAVKALIENPERLLLRLA